MQGAFKNGATIMEIHEVLLHGAVYVGAPAAIEAFRNAQEVFNELGLRLPDEA